MVCALNDQNVQNGPFGKANKHRHLMKIGFRKFAKWIFVTNSI